MEENNQIPNNEVPSNQTPSEKKPITPIITIVLAVVVIGLAGFIVWDKAIKKDNNTNNTTTTTSASGDVTTTTVANGDTTTTTTTTAAQKQQDFDLSKFDQSKIIDSGINKCDTYKLEKDDNFYNFKSQISSDKKSVNVTIDWSKYWHELDDESLANNGSITYTINNFQGTVEKVYVKNFGNGIGNATVFYVMSNGTVEYTPINYSLRHNGMKSTSGLKSYGTIKNVSDVTQISSGGCYFNDGEGNEAAVFGFKTDGSFYNLSGIVSKSDYYSE